jgi:hypothetical protein
VASRTHVVLFDLITLCPQHAAALHSCLGPLLADRAVLKLGFEVAGDLAKLAGSWPCVPGFSDVCGVLDLRPLWVAHGLAAKLQVRWGADKGAGSSCAACMCVYAGCGDLKLVLLLLAGRAHGTGAVCGGAVDAVQQAAWQATG